MLPHSEDFTKQTLECVLTIGELSEVFRFSFLFQESALHMAVRVKDPVALELLMLAGADISLQNIGGWTALQVCP